MGLWMNVDGSVWQQRYNSPICCQLVENWANKLEISAAYELFHVNFLAIYIHMRNKLFCQSHCEENSISYLTIMQ